MEDFGLPTWGSYLIFAIATIIIGAFLGLVSLTHLEIRFIYQIIVYYYLSGVMYVYCYYYLYIIFFISGNCMCD